MSRMPSGYENFALGTLNENPRAFILQNTRAFNVSHVASDMSEIDSILNEIQSPRGKHKPFI